MEGPATAMTTGNEGPETAMNKMKRWQTAFYS
jgi:hypothetical protein